MTETTDWAQWRGSWQAPTSESRDLDDAMARFHRAKRRESIVRVVEWAVVVLAVAFPLVAMRHAANPIEGALGIGAVLITVGVAAFRSWRRRSERRALAESTREFDDAVRALSRAELRFVRFLWLVLAVEGVFATVWWYGGLEVHHEMFSPIAVAMLWIPLAIVAVALGWSIRLRGHALRDLAGLSAREIAAREVDG